MPEEEAKKTAEGIPEEPQVFLAPQDQSTLRKTEDVPPNGRFFFNEIRNKDPFLITASLPGVLAATASHYGVFFTAPFPCEIVRVSIVHSTAGSDAGAVTLQLEKLTGTQALDAGVAVLAATYDLKGTANTVAYPALTTTKVDRILEKGNRLALDDAGTLTAVAGVQVTVEFRPLGQGHYRFV